jgi:hypothetical protein
MEREQGLERPGLTRPPDLDWTLVGGRRGRAGRHKGLTMSDNMEISPWTVKMKFQRTV